MINSIKPNVICTAYHKTASKVYINAKVVITYNR